MSEEQDINGLISTGYETEDYSKPIEPGEDRPKVTRYPTFRVCGEAAAELHKALMDGKCLDGEFAAVVVMSNTMVRVADSDEDEDDSKDVELEFKITGILPDLEGKDAKLEEEIMSDFDKLPKAIKDKNKDDDDDEGDDDDDE
jgi:hypothetical protein